MRASVAVKRPRHVLALAAAAAAVALTFDALDRATSFSIIGTGLLDEPAHLAFGVLALLGLGQHVRLSRQFVIAAVVASVAIDIDHLPLYEGVNAIAVSPGGRPVTHSAITLAALAALWLLWRRRRSVLGGLLFGTAVHFVRDIAEGPPGVPLLWPVNSHAWQAGPWLFPVLVAALVAVIAVAFARRPHPQTTFGHTAHKPMNGEHHSAR